MKHITHQYLLDPAHLVTVAVIGCGGTGSQVLNALAKINTGLVALGHPGIHVTAYDADVVSNSNVGRQLFSPTDISINKAIVSISRINRFFGFDWHSIPEIYDGTSFNIVITCTDNVKSRLYVAKFFKRKKEPNCTYTNKSFMYWLDFGNSRSTGQVVLGSIFSEPIHALKNISEMFDLSEIDENEQGPSCSLAEALQHQDMFINSTLANLGCSILWKLLTSGQLDHHGLFLNLETMEAKGIAV